MSARVRLLAALGLLVALGGCMPASPGREPTPATPSAVATSAATAPAGLPARSPHPVVLTGPAAPVTVLAWSPDGTRLAAAAGGGSLIHQGPTTNQGPEASDAVVRVWSAAGVPLAALEGHAGPVTALAWSPDGQTLASGSRDGTVRLWGPAGTARATLAAAPDLAGPVLGLAWSPDGRTLATGAISPAPLPPLCLPGTPGTPGTRCRARDLPGIVRLWRADGQPVATLRTVRTDGNALNLAWSPDSALLAAGGIDYRLWRPDGAEVGVVRQAGPPAGQLAWSPDGRLLAVGDGSGGVLLATAAGRTVVRLTASGPVRSLAFSPDGQHFAVLTEADLQLYRTAQPGLGQRLLHSQPSPVQSAQPPPAGQAGRPARPGRDSNVAWAPDDARLAASLRDGLLRVWRPDGQMIVILEGCGEALALAWSPDGNTLAAGSRDHTVCLWR